MNEIPSDLIRVEPAPPMLDPHAPGVGQNELAVYLPLLYGPYLACMGNLERIERATQAQKPSFWQRLHLSP